MILLYNILLTIVIIIGAPFLGLAVIFSEKRRKTFFHRLGITGIPEDIKKCSLNDNKPIWIHALSVGEAISAVPLVKELKNRFVDKKILFSVSTATGFEIANKLLSKYSEGCFLFPYDFNFSIKRIAGEIDPALVIIVESDIWPNFLFNMKKRNIPVFLVNARLSNRSFKGYKLISGIMKPLFLSFKKICAQTDEDASRFRQLGIPDNNIIVTGNIKFDQDVIPFSETEAVDLKKNLGLESSRKIIVAGSTHEDEEAILIDAFSKIKKEFPDSFFVIVPRDPMRAGNVLNMTKSCGHSAVTLNDLENEGPKNDIDVLIIDRIGILGMLYAVADIAFIGGSLKNFGGHNPLEPAAYAKPLLFGPFMSDFVQISNMLLDSGGAMKVNDGKELFEKVSILLVDSVKADEMGRNAFNLFNSCKGAVEEILNIIVD
ncbi:MAG: 3-deoxy-D-manno-octulosonic acid transferase [Desulfobacterales bacterium]|jgi:3-deoxy-D-manno-octulosonic-acid transferase|nr:3-deoxy-D-manno-octulosonic acid transferase [Desulfobacteraceae bacterium]MBT4364413.1 3-deoxy-D-manno-octulosonic acid transferase [Desulfobacteraceae bacterium]MBT7696227.1 3-deoxy-D-manno-octulosonic acid transferase [Desulfobacterales bacterium]